MLWINIWGNKCILFVTSHRSDPVTSLPSITLTISKDRREKQRTWSVSTQWTSQDQPCKGSPRNRYRQALSHLDCALAVAPVALLARNAIDVTIAPRATSALASAILAEFMNMNSRVGSIGGREVALLFLDGRRGSGNRKGIHLDGFWQVSVVR